VDLDEALGRKPKDPEDGGEVWAKLRLSYLTLPPRS
jgi:hypothetical protein